MTKIAEWPLWLQLLVMSLHCVLVGVAWYYKPKTRMQQRWMWGLWGYLVAFLVVMYFVFGY